MNMINVNLNLFPDFAYPPCTCFDQWTIEQCETAAQSGECSENGIANNCLKTCGWCCDSNPVCCDNVDGGKKI